MELFEDFVFAEVCLPLALPGTLTYAFPASQAPKRGARVLVPLRGSKLYTGVVWETGVEKPTAYRPRRITELIDSEHPYLEDHQMKFLGWMAEYYVCTLGEVLLAAIPASHRLSSESFVQLPPDLDWNREESDEEELRLMELLVKRQKIALSDLMKAFGNPATCLRKVRQLGQDGLVQILDEVVESYRPRSIQVLHLNEEFCSEEGLDRLFHLLEKKQAETEFILFFLQKTRFSHSETNQANWKIEKGSLELQAIQKKILNRLLKKGIFRMEKEKANPFLQPVKEDYVKPELSADQNQALEEIQSGFSENKTCLLMGVTGSGKTEIYLHLLTDIISQGKQCLLLLPEIGITVQMVTRLRKVFGQSLGVYHSKTGMQEKMEVWEGIRTGTLKLVIGVRSSIFLPFQNLGLLIVDEEHDASFKQSEPPPRYQGRDAAIYLASLFGSKVLLGSATPSVESYYKAVSGKWKLILLTRRFGDSHLPEISFVDMRKAARSQRVRLDFSEDVLEKFSQNHEKGYQSILFQNRRGYAPFMECQDCGWVPYCPSCDVSLTLHQAKQTMNCHYCGHHTGITRHCVACGSVRMQAQGYGTEKLEESLSQLLPGLRVARMDQDSTQSRKSFENLLKGMKNGSIDVLVGTQMVTKGLDFEKVNVVAVFDIDRMLHYPDFRANERAFQLLSQISGRAGRRQIQGEVLIQTRNPAHPVLRYVKKNENSGFFEAEIRHRQDFHFPPFCRLLRITARHKDEKRAEAAAIELHAALLKCIRPDWVFGPEIPVIPRLRNQYIFHITIKIDAGISPVPVKQQILDNIRWMEGRKDFPGIHWIIDADPN